jgi:hypothetical protein
MMVLFTLLLTVVIIPALIGLGWKTFSAGIISGFEIILDVDELIIKNLTQEAKEFVNDPSLMINHPGLNIFG